MAPPDGPADPGPGGPVGRPPPRSRRPGQPRDRFRREIKKWIAAGTDRWWCVPLDDDFPPGGKEEEAKAVRRRVYERTRTTWDREVKRQRAAGLLAGEFTSRLRDLREEDGTICFCWGPKPAKVPPRGPTQGDT